jgi:transposase
LKIEEYNIEELVSKAKAALASEKKLPASIQIIVEALLIVIGLLVQRLLINSSNSSKPPASDPNRKKNPKTPTDSKNKNKPGGQPGHKGTNLAPVDNPDEIIKIDVDQSALPKGTYTEVGVESRQVVNLIIKRHITQYDAQIIKNQFGQKFRAPFPDEVKRPIQYGNTVKAHAVYLSCFQMLPYDRLKDYFENQLSFSMSSGSLCNFVDEAYQKLIACGFDKRVADELAKSKELGTDETGVNINKVRHWIHQASNNQWALFFVHKKRGREAMDAMGILPRFRGIMIHDHWKPYFTYKNSHSLCNAHHLRELTFVEDILKKDWAKKMKDLLIEIKIAVEKPPENKLDHKQARYFKKQYRKILEDGEKESPPFKREDGKKRGKTKQTKDHNLLMRLKEFEAETLRFMTVDFVPFTNNRSENALRMLKVQQKISGCFRSFEGAQKFCLIRSYILTCEKQGINPTDAITMLFENKVPQFLTYASGQ